MLPGVLATLGSGHLRVMWEWPAATSEGGGGGAPGGEAAAMVAVARAAVQLLSAPFAPQAGLVEADTSQYLVLPFPPFPPPPTSLATAPPQIWGICCSVTHLGGTPPRCVLSWAFAVGLCFSVFESRRHRSPCVPSPLLSCLTASWAALVTSRSKTVHSHTPFWSYPGHDPAMVSLTLSHLL